jgi:hypothetical protein
MKIFHVAALSGLFVSLTACSQGTPFVDQSGICQAGNYDEIRNCTPGQLMAWLPAFFGNEQAPIQVAAYFCDFNHPVVHNTGGVVCVYTDKRL